MGFSVVDYAKKKKKDETADSAVSTPTKSGGFSVRDYALAKQAPDRLADYQSFRNKVTAYIDAISRDSQQRNGQYQDKSAFGSYYDKRNVEAGNLLRDAYNYRDYLKAAAAGGSVGQDALDDIESTINYLNTARNGLSKENEYWNQFRDETAYKAYLRGPDYANVKSADDFSEKSQYASTANGQGKINLLATLLAGDTGGIVYKDTGYDDLLYEWINGNEDAGAILKNNEARTSSAASGAIGSAFTRATGGEQQARQMNDDEVGIFNYLYATEGKDSAYQYYDYLQNEMNYRNRQADMERWSNYAQEHPVSSSAFSVAMAPTKGLSYLSQAADYATSGEIDQNSPENKFSYIPSAIRESVNETVEKKWGGVGSFAYNTGMSMGDFLFNTAITGGNQALTLAIIGSGAAADTVIASKDAGLSDDRSFVLGTIAGAAEVITEKFSLETLLDKSSLSKSAFGYFVKNVLAEGSEEVGSDLINWIADDMYDLISGEDNSEFKRIVKAYMTQGYSESEATGMALADRAKEAGLDALGGAVSGGVMAGGAIAIDSIGNRLQGTGAPASGADVILTEPEAAAPAAPAAPGLSSDDMTNSDIAAELVNAGATEEQAQQLAPIIQDILDGQDVSGNQAGAIAKNEAAVAVLESMTGEAINTDAPLGEVKTAIRSLASRQNARSEQTAAEDTPAQTQPVEAAETAPAAPTMEAVTRNNVQAVADFANTMEKAGAAAMTQMYDGSQSAEQYVAGMMRAYNAGKNGTSREEIMGDLKGITAPQARAAYIAGQADARNGGTAVARTAEPRYTNLDNNLEGASESDGETAVYLRDGSQRAGSSYPGGQVSAVEGGAGQNTLRTIQGRPADGETARLSYGEKVSTASLGIGGGSTNASIRLVTGGETASTKAAKQLAKERGLRLVLFAGDNLSIRQADGTVASVRGMYVSGDRVFVRADHPRYTADQLMRHEAGHDAVAKGEVDIEAVKGRLAELYGEDYAEKVSAMYEQAYRGSGIPADGVWEECICDSLGDMNVFDDTEAAKIAEEFLPRVKQATQDVHGKNESTRAPPSASDTNDGGTKFSIEYDASNTPYVVVSSDILAGVPKSKWITTVKNVLAQKFPDGVHVGNEVIKINRQSRREMTFSQYTQWLANNDASAYADKFRAADNADELILASRGYINEGLKHARKDNIRDFARGTVLLRVGKNDYTAEVVVGTTSGGDMLLYDIVNLQRTQIKEKSKRTVPPTKKPSDRSGTPASGANIGQSGATVKGKFPMESPVEQTQTLVDIHNNQIMEIANSPEGVKFSRELDSEGRQLTEGQADYFADSKAVDDQGRLMVMYHGTRKGGFTVFRDWSYLTANRKYAERYMDRETGETMYEVYANIKKPFDTRLEECRAIWENEFYGEYSRTALQESGLPDWTDGYDLVDFLEENGYDYDAILLDEGADQVNGSIVERGISYVVRSSEQIKSVTNANPTSDTDIRFSRELENVEILREQNEALREKAEYWKGQTRRTAAENRTVRQADVDKLARRLTKSYGSALETKELSAQLKELGEYLVRGGDGKNELTWTEVKDRAVSIARNIIDSADYLNDETYQQYSDLRHYLRTTNIIYGKEYHGDIPDFGEFRKRNFGRLNLKTNGRTNIDAVYEEMSEMWPEFFNSAEQTHPTDQLLHIIDVLDSLRPVYENPFSYDMATALEYVSNDIIDGLLSEDVRQAPPTFADRQAAKLDSQKAKDRQKLDRLRAQKNARIEEIRKQGQERTREALRKVRADCDAKIKDIKEHYAETAERRRERAADSRARTRLLKIVKRLQNKKLPAVNRALLDEYIADIDTVAKSLTDGKAQDLRELRDWYEDQRDNNPDFIADAAVEKALSRLSTRHIADLSAKEVEDLTNVLLNIENELRTQKKLIDSAERRDVYNMGVQTITDIENSRGSKGGVLGIPDRYITTETLSPVRQVRRMTGYVDNSPLYVLTNELADGQRKMFDYQRRAGDLFLKWTQDEKFVDRICGKKAEEIEIAGIGKDGPTTVRITPAMRMSLYLHSLNSQNMKHVAGGGVTVPDMKLYKKGKIAEAYARGTTIKLTPSEVRSITSRMTAEEKTFALAAHGYFNGMSQDSINEVSEKLKGYSLAKVEDYFPINTDTSFTKSDFEALKFDGTIEGMGFLKERINSSAPIMLRDMNTVLKQSIDNTAKYVGLGIPVRNFNKVWGVTKASYDEEGNRTGYESSVQQAVKKKWGEDGYRYIENMMADLNTGRPAQDNWAKVLNKIKSNYAGAVLTLNASVAMKQAASYPTAGAVLGFKPLARALADFGKVDMALINKYTPLQWYRTQGFSTQELGDMAKRNKSLPKVLNWVQGVDLLTTRKLWKASEYYVRSNYRDLARGSEAYYRAVADVYNQVIEETQPNYTTMQRPQLLRSENSLMQNLSMFKTQPFQNFNILYDAMGNLRAKQTAYTNTGTEEAKEALGKAKQRAAWAIGSQLAQLAVFSGMTFAWNLFRGKLSKYKDDDDDEMTVLSALKGIGKDMLGGAAAMIPFGSDVWELLSSKLFGDTYYGMDAVTVQALTDAVSSLSGLTDLLTNTVNRIAKDVAVDWNETRLKFDNYFDDISKALGIPYENVNNLFNAFYLQSAKAVQGENLGTYAAMKLTTSPSTYSADYYDLLYKAYTTDREAYETIYADMIEWDCFATENRTTAEAIASAMENRMKADQGVTKAEELDSRYLSPEQQAQYDRTMGTIRGGSIWGDATAEQQDKVEGYLYDLIMGNSNGTKMQEKIDGGAEYGIDETVYLLYKLALSMCDEPSESGKYGSYTNDEVEAAIKMLGLDDEASSYLWLSQGKSEKSNPWG